MRRLVTSAALIGGALGSSGEKLEAQGIHIPGTNMNVSFGNPFKKHGAPQEAPRIITAEDRMKIDTVLAHYNIEKQGFNSYLVTNKEGGYSFPYMISMDGKQVEKSFDEAMLILYENSLSSEAKASVKHALDNEKGLEAEGWLEPKATKPPTPKNN